MLNHSRLSVSNKIVYCCELFIILLRITKIIDLFVVSLIETHTNTYYTHLHTHQSPHTIIAFTIRARRIRPLILNS